MAYSVAQNTTFLTVASIAQKIISFAYFTFVARVIGVSNTGQYFFAISFTTIFTVVADFGLGPVLTREAAKYPENSEKYFNTVFWTKVIFGVAAYLLVVFSINALHYAQEIKILVYLSGITMFFDNLQIAFFNIFRARKNLIYEAVGLVGAQLLTMIIGTIALFTRAPLYWLIIAYTIPSFLNFLYAAIFVRRVTGIHYRFVVDWRVLKLFISVALPFAGAGIISRLYAYSDSILMSKMLGSEHLGWWSVPYKITFAFQFIPVALAASVYPVMSVLSLKGGTEIGSLFEKAWRYLFIIVFPLSFGLMALARPIIIQLYGANYIPSVSVLQTLLVSLPFGYLSFITGALLNATNHQKIQTLLLGLALVTNVILNLALIPVLGINGAALAAVASNAVLCLGGFYFVRRFVAIDGGRIIKFAFQSIWPAAIMAVAALYLVRKVNFILVIPAGVVMYGSLLMLSGGLSRQMVASALRKVWNPVKISN